MHALTYKHVEQVKETTRKHDQILFTEMQELNTTVLAELGKRKASQMMKKHQCA